LRHAIGGGGCSGLRIAQPRGSGDAPGGEALLLGSSGGGTSGGSLLHGLLGGALALGLLDLLASGGFLVGPGGMRGNRYQGDQDE
jgi:hypothetical protein